MTIEQILEALRVCATHEAKGCGVCQQRQFVHCQERLADEAITLVKGLADENTDLHKEIEWKDMVIALAQRKQAEVIHGKPVTKIRTVMLTGYHEEIGVFAKDGSNLYRKKMAQADIPYDHCPVCGAVLCSRWHNFCGKCGAKMDGGQQNE